MGAPKILNLQHEDQLHQTIWDRLRKECHVRDNLLQLGPDRFLMGSGPVPWGSASDNLGSKWQKTKIEPFSYFLIIEAV